MVHKRCTMISGSITSGVDPTVNIVSEWLTFLKKDHQDVSL